MRDFMVGNIAVGIVIVDGKAGTDAEFTSLEKLTVAVEVGQGFEILYNLKSKAAPGSAKVPLFFMARTEFVKLDLDPASIPPPPLSTSPERKTFLYEGREQLWRDPALNALGCSSGQTGISQYLNKLMAGNWAGLPTPPDAAYVLFVTKYSVRWMAYASQGLGRIVMSYNWVADKTGNFRGTGERGYGDADFDRVFAHETCHIFGAPDEYAPQCNVTDIAGHLKIPNGNCEANNPNSVDCIMKGNTPAMCRFTPRHLGWVDSNGNGILDVFEP